MKSHPSLTGRLKASPTEQFGPDRAKAISGSDSASLHHLLLCAGGDVARIRNGPAKSDYHRRSISLLNQMTAGWCPRLSKDRVHDRGASTACSMCKEKVSGGATELIKHFMFQCAANAGARHKMADSVEWGPIFQRDLSILTSKIWSAHIINFINSSFYGGKERSAAEEK